MPKTNTDAHAATTVAIVQMAVGAQDPLRRVRYLSDAQMQLGWALRAAVQECQEASMSWQAIGDALGVPKETVFRQFSAGGPVITAKPVQSKDSPGLTDMHRSSVEAVYAFCSESGTWFGPDDALPFGEFADGILDFDPAEPASPFAGQRLTMRFGHWEEGVTAYACQVTLPGGQQRRVRVTNTVMDFLFGDGQTPLRQAMTAVTNATLGNPRIPGQMQAVIEQAARKMGMTVPVRQFVDAVENVVALAPLAAGDQNALIAMRRLQRVVEEYRTWAASADR
jgi:hypothetical protein